MIPHPTAFRKLEAAFPKLDEAPMASLAKLAAVGAGAMAVQFQKERVKAA
jgi:hypothetical protein